MQPLPAYRAELGWRLGLALAALNFVLLGLAVASANPRAAPAPAWCLRCSGSSSTTTS